MAINIGGTALRVLTLDATNFETVTLDGVVFARKPTITTQPVGGTITDAQSHAMTMAADGLGTAVIYQWFMDGAAISGATGAAYTFTPAGNTTNRTFFCRASGFGGGYTQTSTVTVTVNPSWTVTHNADQSYNAAFLNDYLLNIVPNSIAGANGSPDLVLWNGSGSTFSISVTSENNPASSRIVFSCYGNVFVTLVVDNQSNGWTVYAGATPSDIWPRVGEGALVPRTLSMEFFASREAQEANEPYTEDLGSPDEYLMKWGVHKEQRPDLYI